MQKLVLVTGGFDPLHSGHISYFKSAATLGDRLVVGVNSDEWLKRKKGAAFMPFYERALIVENLNMVDQVIAFDDSDNTAVDAIHQMLVRFPTHQIIFANGGDRTQNNIPEMAINSDRVDFLFGIGGADKKNSSSWILQEWKAPKIHRPWGYYRVLHDVPNMKVKELTVEPGQSLSMQRHRERAEYWIVSSGQCVVCSQTENKYQLPPVTLKKHNEFKIPVMGWHQLTNPFNEPCQLVEIQYGTNCIEDDIEREQK